MRSLLTLWLLLGASGCAAKFVLLPEDAATYYKKLVESEKDLQECEHDRQTCEEDCESTHPYIGN